MDEQDKRELITAADMAGLSAEFGELLADAERYRWLRNDSCEQFVHPLVVSQERRGDHMRYVGPMLGPTLDAAIDAAMASPTKEQ